MRLPAFIFLGLVGALAAHAQSKPPEVPPAKGRSGVGVSGVMTPERLTGVIEDISKAHEARGAPPFRRNSQFYLFYADTAAEHAQMAHYSVLLLTVLTQEAPDLPVNRVYVRIGGRDNELPKLSSWRVEVGEDTLTRKVSGPNREDAFYLFPTQAIFQQGQVLVDFTYNRVGMPIIELPFQVVPDRVKTFPKFQSEAGSKPEETPRLVPSGKPSLKAVQALIARKTSGFPIPQWMP